MKKPLTLILFLSGITLSSCSQEIPASKVPSVIVNAIHALYPAALKVEWEKYNNVYVAEFDIGKKELTVQFNEGGSVIMKKEEIMEMGIPSNILGKIKAGYKNYLVDDAEKIEKGGGIYYQLELEAAGKKDLKLVFDASGNEAKNFTYWD